MKLFKRLRIKSCCEFTKKLSYFVGFFVVPSNTYLMALNLHYRRNKRSQLSQLQANRSCSSLLCYFYFYCKLQIIYFIRNIFFYFRVCGCCSHKTVVSLKGLHMNLKLSFSFVSPQSMENVMSKLRSIIEETYILRDFVPLNLFMLDNRHVKKSLAMLVWNIYDFIIDFYLAVNLNENRA